MIQTKRISDIDSGQITVHEPLGRRRINFLRSSLILFENVVKSRQLIFQLFRRDFFNSYRKSFLGAGWLIISPIIAIASWVLMNATGILSPGDVGVPYPVYVLLGSTIWGLFINFYNAGKMTLDSGAGFILQVKYPHEALLFKQGLQELSNFAISLLLNVVVFVCFGVTPSWKLILLPIALLPLFLLGAGLGLLLAVIKVVVSDLERAFTVLLGFCIYITPVIYSPRTKNLILQKIIAINPLTYLIGTARDLMIPRSSLHYPEFAIASGLSLAVFLIGWRLFYLSEEMIIEKMM